MVEAECKRKELRAKVLLDKRSQKGEKLKVEEESITKDNQERAKRQ